MAETVLYNTVTEILKKLGSIVLQEIRLVSGVRNELDKLKNTVSAIEAILVHAGELQATDPEMADWLEKLNDAFYDADDLLDDYSTEGLRRQVVTQNKRLKKVRNFFSSSNSLAFSSKMAREIKTIRERLDAIAEDKKNFHFSEGPLQMRVKNTKREETHSFVHAESVIGRDDDKIAIIKLLLESSVQENVSVHENVSVVALVGIGGLGKTTLAQFVYNDKRVTKHFELKMWVCVSDVFHVKLIAEKIIESATNKESETLSKDKMQEKIIESATNKKSENLSMDKMQEKLRKKIDGKKYLLVLDDMWNDDREKWLELRVLLMGGSKGSKILVTTRSDLVANVNGANSPYLLKGLSEEESWTLFKQMALKEGEEHENPSRVIMGKEIVQKCKGVPLAIRAIGSLLYSKDTDAEWLVFKNNDLLKIAQEEDVILSILKFSYDYLPSYLKRCFAFCSLYLKDEKIGKQELIQLWIAHGFIQPVYENQQLENRGDLYFMDLLRRSLFQDIERDEWGDIISCKMHDLVHDLAKSVAKVENSTLNLDAKNVTERTRHVSLGFSVNSSWEILNDLGRAKKLRTFILKNEELKERAFENIVSTFKRLRVLDLSKSEKIMTVPNNIRKLKHLRYLDLSNNEDIKTLPSSMTKLQNLQTLKLNGCYKLKKFPRDFKILVNLRHLELDKCFGLTHMPRGLGQLTHLLKLTWFVTDSNGTGLNELQSLDNLEGRLVIQLDGRGKGWCLKKATATGEGRDYLEAKQYLKTLELRFGRKEDDELRLKSLRPHPNLKELKISKFGGVSFPSWMMVHKIGLLSSLPNLVGIYMVSCHGCKHLPQFGQLPSLQFLTLDAMNSVEYIDNSSSGSGSGSGGEESLSSSLPSSSSGGGAAAAIRRSEPRPTFFPSLKQLTLDWLPELKGWWRSEEAAVEEEATATLLDQHQHQQHLKKSLPSFPCLSKLIIHLCPNLASMPILQPCLEELYLENVSKKVVEEELMMSRVCPTPSTISTTTRTETVAISSSSNSLLPLSNLKSLSLSLIKDVESLPVGLRHLTTLRTLRISRCENLMALPEWIGNIASLERLHIFQCPKLTSLPDGMRQLTALQHLTIRRCAEVLYDRCQKEAGEDWPKIAHIPNVHISWR